MSVTEDKEVDLDEKIPVSKFHMRIGKSYFTVYNWRNIGVENKRTGKRVFLDWTQEGGQGFITMRMYQKFIEDSN